jgi:small-conductance mechanosensitive channel
MTLADNKQKVDQAIEQLETLDSLIQDTEERTERMQKAREWLAKTETRLEEINTQAKEQVKLLGSLLKSGKKGAKESEGAPSMGAREIVTRLAHQGWSVDEIARATKLSRGEVELILEIVPRK